MKKITELLKAIQAKRGELELLGGIALGKQTKLDEWELVELTYTSNAIEGNTLSRAETALVISDEVTVAGKSIREHQEAVNTAAAWEWVKERVDNKPGIVLDNSSLLHLHEIVLRNIDNQNAGKYRNVAVRIAGSRTVLPNPAKVPTLMQSFWSWLGTESEAIERAVEAHYKLVTIHPFTDGNGRTARLVMNLILRASGYPPIIIRKEDRGEYLTSLEIAQTGGSKERCLTLMLTSLLASLDRYFDALNKSENTTPDKLMMIGKLARGAGESVATIRHWVAMGIIPVKQVSAGGYQLFEPRMVERAKQVRQMQKKKRYSLEEIRKELG